MPKSQSFLKKKSFCAKSREELFDDSPDLCEIKQHPRRTKIVGTVSDNINTYEKLRDLVKGGLNILTINMAYSSTQAIIKLRQYRDQLEEEFKKQIPIICTLKGTLIRLGQLQKAEIFLKKGQQYRLVLHNGILGNEHYCGIDDKELGSKIRVGDSIIIDYGQISMTVLRIENACDSIKYLKEQIQNDFEEFAEVESQSKKIIQQNIQQEGDINIKAQNIIQKGDFYCIMEDDNNNKFAKQLKIKNQQKKKNYQVIVCVIDNDCMIKSHKPIFIYQRRIQIQKSSLSYQKKYIENIKEYQDEQENDNDSSIERKNSAYYEDEDDEQCCITPKDIIDINWCVNNNIDCICVSNVQSAKQIKAVRKIIGKEHNISIIARIQTNEAVDHIEEIIKESDGIQIARGYLTIHIPVEKLYIKQREMIKKSHEYMKPVFISCNILNSMVSSLLPSMCEIGEISNLVNEYVDCIVLSSETSCGQNPVEVIKTLERVCLEAEKIRIFDKSQLKSMKITIQSCIIECGLQAAFNINAQIIIVFTTRGYTALKMSKLRPPCPILAITSDKRVARLLCCVCGIQSYLIQSLLGTESLIKIVLDIQKAEGRVKTGDFVVVTYGDVEDKANQTNNVKVLQVE